LTYLVKEMGIPKNRTYRLKQGVDLEMFDQKTVFSKVDKLRRKMGLEGKKVITYVGHLDIASDLDVILKALKPILSQVSRARLLIIGDGQKKREFQFLAAKQEISEKVVWVGLVGHAEIAPFLELSDVCLVYYKKQKANNYRVSMKLREYLAMAKKVVTNDVGELEDFRNYVYQTSSNLSDFGRMTKKVLLGWGDGREKKGQVFVRQSLSWRKLGRNLAKKLNTI